MKIEKILKKTEDKISLTIDESEILFREIMDGKFSDELLKKILLSLSNKGESVEEITGGAKVLRDKASKVDVSGNLIDTCGTGGDGKNTVNISTVVTLPPGISSDLTTLTEISWTVMHVCYIY